MQRGHKKLKRREVGGGDGDGDMTIDSRWRSIAVPTSASHHRGVRRQHKGILLISVVGRLVLPSTRHPPTPGRQPRPQLLRRPQSGGGTGLHRAGRAGPRGVRTALRRRRRCVGRRRPGRRAPPAQRGLEELVGEGRQGRAEAARRSASSRLKRAGLRARARPPSATGTAFRARRAAVRDSQDGCWRRG